MQEQTKYMNFEQFAKTFMAASHEIPNRMYTELFANMLIPSYRDAWGLIDGIYIETIDYSDRERHPRSDKEKLEVALAHMPPSTRECFKQLVMALNDNSPEAQSFLKMASAVSSIGVPAVKNLTDLLNIIRAGGIKDPKLSYEYLNKIEDMSRDALKGNSGTIYMGLYPERFGDQNFDYRRLITISAREIAHHPLATAKDKIYYASLSSDGKAGRDYEPSIDEQLALLTEAAEMVKTEISKTTDIDKIESIIDHEVRYIMNAVRHLQRAVEKPKQILAEIEGVLKSFEDTFGEEKGFAKTEEQIIQPARYDLNQIKEILARLEKEKGTLQTKNDMLQGTMKLERGEVDLGDGHKQESSIIQRFENGNGMNK